MRDSISLWAGGQEEQGLPRGTIRAGAGWQPGPVPPLQPGAGQSGSTRAPQPQGIRHLTGDRHRDQAGTWACRWVPVSGAHGQTGQGCGELHNSPAATSLRQGLVGPRG